MQSVSLEDTEAEYQAKTPTGSRLLDKPRSALCPRASRVPSEGSGMFLCRPPPSVWRAPDRTTWARPLRTSPPRALAYEPYPEPNPNIDLNPKLRPNSSL